MSFIKFSSDLFVGGQELGRYQDFMIEHEKIRLAKEAKSFGLLLNGSNAIGTNFFVQTGSSSGTVKIATESYAIDGNINYIKKRIEDNIAIPNNSDWYWLRVKYASTNKEDGIVNIDANGNLTGVGTNFTKVLRGYPDFPSKIKFIDSSLNVSEYEVVNVISDTTAILAGIFSAESNISYKVVGTFSPGITIDESKKYPFNYDSCELVAVLETVTDTAPSKSGGAENLEFYIARVRNVSGTVTIQDKRTEFFRYRWE